MAVEVTVSVVVVEAVQLPDKIFLTTTGSVPIVAGLALLVVPTTITKATVPTTIVAATTAVTAQPPVPMTDVSVPRTVHRTIRHTARSGLLVVFQDHRTVETGADAIHDHRLPRRHDRATRAQTGTAHSIRG